MHRFSVTVDIRHGSGLLIIGGSIHSLFIIGGPTTHFVAEASALVVATTLPCKAITVVVIDVTIPIIINPVIGDLLSVDPYVWGQVRMGKVRPCVYDGHNDVG